MKSAAREEYDMSTKLTREQAEVLTGDTLRYDDSPWTLAERAALAAAAFGKLDDTDYRHFLPGAP
jgi:hypothetical protein